MIKRERLRGVVYNMDDDNGYHPSLWNELRRLRPMRVGVFAVRRGAYPPAKCDGTFDVLKPGSGWKYREHMIERPTYDATSGRFTGFEAGWCDPDAWNWNKQGRRDFCVDMGGFAFDARLLHALDEGPIWNYTGHGGESELVGRLLCSDAPEDLQPLANCGQDVLVFHNEYRIVPVAVRRPRVTCGFDGWGVAHDEVRLYARDEVLPLQTSLHTTSSHL
ncbi:galactosylgalactosylxylosylprotein 3-beta-glucuronosyltransferase i-like protein [Chrysochromulina tobinii]|uniref:Galactosylgalactosylxylosylprotein 3-beta-glucuronosyltransferase i-like protein n=1 Tax=Chrysochromulina tobinii TaxID=1460289 RepID=A0A0M0KAW1_9EUKA|nr:galactosylgalactosylxylosylprotein 3-beta-glucuronosyltransferase i-like protein [Chrysochromulina tobinii]|eukprot:KOO35747.1 galactosylgalactosylxylosylprotein 3-beta-glucuronosyltransferase i-like protein [Chrysochromulina sp. CCMP291]